MLSIKTIKHQAFSLIEISIVVIIIGILISGISAGIDLYDDYKLRVAQNMTKNSRVGRINNLELWLETTTEYSLATGTTSFIDKLTLNNQDQVGRWNDINPNILPIAHNNETQATLNNKPKYIRKSLNGLPTLSFDGTNDFFSYNGNFLVGSEYTIFIVEARGSGKTDNCLMGGSSTVNNSNLHIFIGFISVFYDGFSFYWL
jgi:prepilin-type N-terminal cleavage/methylation domain-containing protein